MRKASNQVLQKGTKRILRKARKLDRRRVLELAASGMSTVEIARSQGVNKSSVFRFLRTTEPERQAVEEFKSKRADVFARIQGLSLDLQERILNSIDDGVLSALTAAQKSSLLHVLNAQAGTLYDKERLELGKSTQNVGVLARIMGTALDTAHKGVGADASAEEIEGSAAE